MPLRRDGQIQTRTCMQRQRAPQLPPSARRLFQPTQRNLRTQQGAVPSRGSAPRGVSSANSEGEMHAPPRAMARHARVPVACVHDVRATVARDRGTLHRYAWKVEAPTRLTMSTCWGVPRPSPLPCCCNAVATEFTSHCRSPFRAIPWQSNCRGVATIWPRGGNGVALERRWSSDGNGMSIGWP